MPDSLKTLIFVLTAIVMVTLAAVASWPVKPQYHAASIVGQPLFPDLKDALSVNSLEITQYDEQKAEIVPFEVRQVNRRWVLPSHFSYPADAKDQVVRAAMSLISLDVISVVSENASSHAEYGVLAPEMQSLRAGTRGVGRKVVMKDEKGNVLLDLIIGKEVSQGSGKRYVRRTGQDPVYTVELDTSQLSSDFSDWIEKDLMKIHPWDIMALNVLDYSLQPASGSMAWNGIVKLRYLDMQDTAWQLISNQIPLGTGAMRDRGMPAGKVLDEDKLDDCRNALAEMRVVDVARKPEGLSQQLKDPGDYDFGEEAEKSLSEKGFYLVRMQLPDGSTEVALLSTEGEITVTTKTGLRYILRFGNVAGADTKDAATPMSLNRYLFIMAELDTDSIPKPQPIAVPEIPEGLSDAARAQQEIDRDAIIAMNREALEDYERDLGEAKSRAEMLNERFAEWYYVIPESVYQEIRLTSDSIFIDEAEAKERAHDHHHHHGEDCDCDHGHEGHVCDENCPHHEPETETPVEVESAQPPQVELPMPVTPEIPETSEEEWPVYVPQE